MKTIGLSAAAFLLALAAPVHAADYYVSVRCGAGLPSTNDSSFDASNGCSNSINYPNYVLAAADANSGGLHAEAHGDGHQIGQADAILTDNYVVNAPGMSGAPGTLKFTYYIHGTSAGPNSQGRVELSVSSNDVYTDPLSAIAFVQYFNGKALVGTTAGLGVALTFGAGNNIATWLDLYSGQGEINFDSTVLLVGLQAFDSAGNPVNATITGDGGLDYSALAASNAASLGLGVSSVPEPSTWALMLVGFAAAGLIYRRSARSALV
jgi:hypothetical protein